MHRSLAVGLVWTLMLGACGMADQSGSSSREPANLFEDTTFFDGGRLGLQVTELPLNDPDVFELELGVNNVFGLTGESIYVQSVAVCAVNKWPGNCETEANLIHIFPSASEQPPLNMHPGDTRTWKVPVSDLVRSESWFKAIVKWSGQSGGWHVPGEVEFSKAELDVESVFSRQGTAGEETDPCWEDAGCVVYNCGSTLSWANAQGSDLRRYSKLSFWVRPVKGQATLTFKAANGSQTMEWQSPEIGWWIPEGEYKTIDLSAQDLSSVSEAFRIESDAAASCTIYLGDITLE